MTRRRYPIGSEVQENGVHFRVWAPDRRRVAVCFDGRSTFQLSAEEKGYFSGLITTAKAGDLYRFLLDDSETVPDPVSRYQPKGPHGPSQIIDPSRFSWSDAGWEGRDLPGLVIYELHIGTFTPEGIWSSARDQLSELAELGVNCIEVMPVAEFAGKFGWGYDGVDLFAPSHLYGAPDDFRRFVDTAHQLEIAVVLDVVYNHLGPDGNYLGKFAAAYFTERYVTDWGAAINFDGQKSGPVREFFLTNVAYWIQEFHLDGLRLDATQNIYDDSPISRHILTDIGKTARSAAPERTIVLIAENEPQHPRLCRPVNDGGHGFDAVWNDDYHHSAMVALTGQREAYYTDYLGNPQEFVSAAKYGYLYQGQWYSWQKNGRGQPGLDLAPSAFVCFLQNHDQVANLGLGLRAHQLASPARYRALAALTLLMPGTPMLFQGQEFSASSPFLYFADHNAELTTIVQNGRLEFLAQFPRLQDKRMVALFAPPHDAQTFRRCKLDLSERQTHAAAYQMTKDLLKLRQSFLHLRMAKSRAFDGAVIGPQTFVLRYFRERGEDRLLVVNLGPDLELRIVAEPLLAAPADMEWQLLFSSEEPRYGGKGVRFPEMKKGGWFISADATMLLVAKPKSRQAIDS